MHWIKNPRYVPGISYTRTDLGEFTDVINMETINQSEGGGKGG